jgi:NAD(P)-dependent dehydrogenase (short-subunit alcohol dehydrogenase family)
VEPLASADIRPGAVWVATGGARGITAASALALGQRYGLRLHLIGGTAIEPIEREWLALDERGLAELKTRVMRAACERGEQPQAAWGRIEKSLEMTRWLRAFEEAGVWARYHACNVGDRAALAAVLEAVRRESGPIEGVLHGAGVDIPRRFEKKELAGVRATLAAKIDGAANLMALTWNDPVRHFIGYGSVSGRLGSNGQTDYAAASDMLAKLVAWYSHLRPECRAIAFHWAPWDEIGMAARPENRVALKVKDAPKLLPKDEGLSHLVRELYDGGRAREVLIIDPTYHKLFYNKGEPPAESEPEAAPLPAGQMQTQPPVPAPSPAAAQRAAQVAEPALTERHVLRLVEAPPAHSAEPGRIAGTTLIVGENAAAIALESRLVAAGSRVLRIGTAGTRDEALARLEAAWRESPAETLILASSADDAAEHIFEPGQWRERLEQGVLAPYFLLQRWRQLWLGWEGRSRATVLGLVRLGGDFGLGGNCAAPEGGAIAGMLKSLKIEDLRSQANALRVRVVDVRSDEAPSSVAEYLHRELREAGDEIEVSWLSGRRLALRPLAETAPPGEAEIPRGGVWVVTGGGCGISAATALALGQRYGLKLHLIGRTPLAAPDAAWRHKSPAELEALKAEILRRPAMNGQSPQAA